MTIKIGDPHIAFVLQDEIRRSEEARYDHRLHAVLLVAKGMSCPEASDYLGDSERTVRYWINQYMENGLQGLIEEERPGRPSRLTKDQIEQINHALRRKPEDAGLKEVYGWQAVIGLHTEGIPNQFGHPAMPTPFRQLRFRLRKPRPMIAHADPEVQEDFKKQYEAG